MTTTSTPARESSTFDATVGVVAGVFAVVVWAGWIVWTAYRVETSSTVQSFTPFDIALLRLGPPMLLLAPFWLKPLLFSRKNQQTASIAFAHSWKPPTVSWRTLVMLLGWGAPFVLLAGKGLTIGGAPMMAALVPGCASLFAAAIGASMFQIYPNRTARIGLALIAMAALIAIAAATEDRRPAAPWFLAASFGWGCYIVAFPRAGLPALRAVGLVSAWSTALLLLMAPFAPSRLLEVGLDSLLLELFLQGGLSGAASIIAYSYALKRAPQIVSANLPVAVPLLAATFSAVFLGAPPNAWQSVGLGCVTAGLLVLTAAARRKRL